MTTHIRKPYKGACAIAIFGLILALVAIATPEWTNTPNVTIGLWTLKDSGTSYHWTNTGEYEGDYFYSNWFNAVRALMMAGVIIGGLGIFFNIYVIAKIPRKGGIVLFVYYLLAFSLLITAVAVYSSLIPQGVDANCNITSDKEQITEYIYLGGYGYSLWIGWICSGVFLLAAGMSYEGANQQIQAKKMADFINA